MYLVLVYVYTYLVMCSHICNLLSRTEVDSLKQGGSTFGHMTVT